MKDLILDDSVLAISNFFRNPQEEGDDSYFNRKMQFIKQHGMVDDLLVIDNFDVSNDPNFNDIMGLPISIIFTTRLSRANEGYCDIYVKEITEKNDLMLLFRKNYPREFSTEDQALIFDIIKFLNGHTLAIRLVSSLMKEQRITPKNMLAKLNEDVIKTLDLFSDRQSHANYLISSIFLISQINEGQKKILMNLALVPTRGIQAEDFYAFCHLDSFEEIDNLITSNWILHDPAIDKISLHPIISALILTRIGYSDELCGNYVLSITDKMERVRFSDITKRIETFDMIDRLIQCVPPDSIYYEKLFLSSGKAFHYLAQHHKTIQLLEKFVETKISPLSRSKALREIADAYRCLVDHENLFKACLRTQESLALVDDCKEKKRVQADLDAVFGWYYWITKDYQKSFSFFKNKLDAMEALFMDDQEYVGWAYFNMGLITAAMKNYPDSAAYYQKAVEIFEKLHADFALANTYISLGNSLFEQKSFVLAHDYALKAYKLFTHLLGEEHCDVASCHHLLAKLYSVEGKMKESQMEEEKASNILVKFDNLNMFKCSDDKVC